MSTTTRRSNGSRTHEDHSASSRQIEREIARTRHDMDETLHEIGERLHPRHLFDQVLDLFRSDEGKVKRDEYARGARDVGQQILREARKHPVPLMLCGAGLAWLAYEELTRDEQAERWRELDRYSEPHGAVAPGGAYTGPAGSEWRSAAWSKDFDWSGAEEDEETWTARAQRTIDEMKASIGDTSVGARDRLKAVAAKTFAMSGRKRKDLHAQWASLKEHSGSFVDARTGEPYDDDYGNDVHSLLACDYCATAEWSDEDQPGMSEKAHGVLEDIRATLSKGGSSAKESLRAVAAKIGGFVGGTRETATGFGHHIADASRRFGHQVGHQASHTWEQARHGSARMGRQIGSRVKDGAAMSRDAFTRATDEAPLAVGAAFLGLGLIAGLALPRTRAEDEWMGEASDEFKDRARHTGEEIVERGQHVAQATLAAASDEAERQGLTAEQLGEKVAKSMEKVERVAERAVDEASREAQHEAEEVVQHAGGTSGQKQRTEQASGQNRGGDACRM